MLGPYDPFVEAIETSQGAHRCHLLIAISTQSSSDGDLFLNWLNEINGSLKKHERLKEKS